MSTFLAQKATCGWCCKPDATLLCLCRQVSFCTKECQVKAFEDSHKFVCSAKRGKSHKLKEGDIVEISGLTSPRGSQMNGATAEVQGPDPKNPERLAVLFSKSDKPWEIEQVSINKSNLSLKLGVHEAARQAKRWRKKNKEMVEESYTSKGSEWDKEVEDALSVVNSGEEEIVKAIQQGNSTVASLLAMYLDDMKEMDTKETDVVALLNLGLINACLNHFHYPLSIDSDAPRGMEAPDMVVLLRCIIQFFEMEHDIEDHEGLEENIYQALVPKLGPLILLTFGKKNRLFHSTEYWATVNNVLLNIMSQLIKCPMGRHEVFKLPEYIVSALLNHMVLLLTVNPKEMLQTTAPAGLKEDLDDDNARFRVVSTAILFQIVQDPSRNIEAAKIAMTKMAAGSDLGLAGKPFASCILDVFALHGFEEEKQRLLLMELLKIKNSGRFPEVQAVMDEDDRNYQEFLAISSVESSSYDNQCYRKWCIRRYLEQYQHS